MAKYYTPRIGSVWLRAFDEGIVKALGAVSHTVGEGRNNYYVSMPSGSCISQGTSLDIPVIFGNPDPLFEKKIYPAFSVKREGATPALERWHPGAMQEFYGIPGTESVVNGVTQYGQVRQSPQAWPYDINYTISVYSKYEYEAQTLLQHMLRKFPPRWDVSVLDSYNEVRTYDMFNDSDVADQSEIVDISERVKSYSISVKIEGEIDLTDPIVNNSVQSVEMSAEVL